MISYILWILKQTWAYLVIMYIVVIALYLADILAVSKSWNDWFKKTVIGMYLYLFLVRLVHVKHLMPVVAGPLKNVLKLLVALGLRALKACWACFLYVLSTLKTHAVRKRLQGGLHLSGLKGWKSQLRLRHGFRAWMDQGDSFLVDQPQQLWLQSCFTPVDMRFGTGFLQDSCGDCGGSDEVCQGFKPFFPSLAMGGSRLSPLQRVCQVCLKPRVFDIKSTPPPKGFKDRLMQAGQLTMSLAF